MSSAGTLCERCGSEMPPKAVAFLHEGKVVCRDCHDEVEPICPTCKKPLKQRPERTSPCPMCGWAIHIAREQDLYDTTLLNKEQYDGLMAFRKKLGLLRRFGVTEGRYHRIKARLALQLKREPTDVEVMRRAYFLATKEAKDDADRAAISYAEARYMFENGLDYFHVLKRAHRLQLESYKAQGIDGVTIHGPAETCAYCKKRRGAPLVVDREIKEPELPYPDCPNKSIETKVFIDGELTHHGVSKHAFCDAKYEPYRE